MGFVALLRFIAAGEANVGHLWKDSNVIHRSSAEVGDVLRPPQMALDASEERSWRESHDEMFLYEN